MASLLSSSCEEEDVNKEGRGDRRRCMIGWLGSLTLSLGGGLMLSWWQVKYHHPNNNHQQWMVPLGLILLFTPLFVCSALFISDLCCVNSSSANTTTLQDHHHQLPHDPEK